MSKKHFLKFNNRNDFISFVEDMRDAFGCPEDWEKFFGFRLECDEDGIELETVKEYAETKCFLYEPCSNEYPVVCYTNFDSNRDRFGDFMIRIFEYISMDKLNKQEEIRNE